LSRHGGLRVLIHHKRNAQIFKWAVHIPEDLLIEHISVRLSMFFHRIKCRMDPATLPSENLRVVAKLRQISLVHPRTFLGGVGQQSVKKIWGVRDYLWSFLAIIQI
jgi:hypothetical protein